MTHDPTELCRRFGLTHVETTALELRRQRCGKGFAYRDGTGKAVSDKALKARINRLAIPPAWTEVCIAGDERAHIQAIGRDAEGRLQYRYHPEWDKARGAAKETRLKRLGSALPRVRNAVKKALAAPGLTRTKVVATIVRLIDRALLRPGYEEYARSKGRQRRVHAPEERCRRQWRQGGPGIQGQGREGDQGGASRPDARARPA